MRFWDEEGFTSCEGVKRPLRVLRTEETVRRRERIAGRVAGDGGDDDLVVGDDADEGASCRRGGCGGRGHDRWDIENNGFNVLATHWGLDHCFKHAPAAIVNFLLTSFIVYALLQSFWQRNLKPAARAGLTLIGLCGELDRGVVGCRAPWSGRLARAP